MQREISPNASKISQVGKDLHPIESVPKGLLANRVHRIHEEYVLDLISSTGVAGGKGWLVGVMEMSPNVGKSPEGGSVYSPQSQNWRDFWQTEYAESMKNMVWMLYPVLELLGAEGGQ